MGVAVLPSDEPTMAEVVRTMSSGCRLLGMPGVLEILFRTLPGSVQCSDNRI